MSFFLILRSIFNMLTMQWQGLLSLTFISVLILNSSSELAGAASLSFQKSKTDSSIKSWTMFADSSLAITKQTSSQNLLQQLNLTVDQRQKINQIHYRYKQQIIKKRQNLAKLQQQLSDMMVGAEAAELIRMKNQQLVNMHQEISALRFETMLATREILTLQQRQKFRELAESKQTQ